MKKQERTWKEYKFRFSDMRLTVIDGPGAEWVCVLAGWRKQLPDPKKRVGRQRVGDVAKPWTNWRAGFGGWFAPDLACCAAFTATRKRCSGSPS